MRYRVKIVPRAEPNAEGRWIELEIEEALSPTSWIEAARVIDPLVPAGHFFVMYERLWSKQ